jgi:DHA2 family multidrug resistance protein
MWVPLSVVTFASLAPAQLPQASSLFHLIRNFGSSIFISISVMAVVRTGKVSYAELSENITPYREALQFPAVTGGWTTESINGLIALGGEVDRQSQMIGYTNAFYMYTLCCFAALPFLLLVKIQPGD